MAVRLRPLRAACFVLSACLGACDESDALDLQLVADPKVNTVAQVLERIEKMELIVDSESGLYALGEERVDGRLRIEDVDGDPALELVVDLPVPDARLPRIRLERGGLPDTPLELRLVGYARDGSVAIAKGSVIGARFGAGRVALPIPFDLLPSELPPRVVDVVVAPPSGCVPPSLTLLFSRAVDPATVFAAGAIHFDPGGAPSSARIDAGGRLVVLVAPSAVATSSRIHFELRLESSILALDGTPLDQAPAAEGSQAYVGVYDSSCAP